MRQTIKNLVLVAMMLLSTSLVFSYDFEVNGIYYNRINDSTVEVTYKDCDGGSYSGLVLIP